MFPSKLDSVFVKNMKDMVFTTYGKPVISYQPIVRTLSSDSGFTSIGSSQSAMVPDKVYYGFFNGSFEMKTAYDLLQAFCNNKNIIYQRSSYNTGYTGPVWMPFCTQPVLFEYAVLSVMDGGTISSFFQFVGIEINL